MILKLDYDTYWKLPLREVRRRARIAQLHIVRILDRRSPSGRGWHRLIEIQRSEHSHTDSAMEIVALQLLFGSDPVRESFNYHRARLVDARQVPPFWRRRWNTLYATSGGR